MNNSEQAKNGFKTFILTFGISLLVFGFFYYLLSDAASSDVSIESEAQTNTQKTTGQTTKADTTAALPTTAGPSVSEYTVTNSAGPAMPEVAGVSDSQDTSSPFGELTVQKPDVQQRTVLAGADAQESTVPVPDTGNFSITLAIMTSTALLGFFVYILVLNPRRYALAKFEEKVVNELD